MANYVAVGEADGTEHDVHVMYHWPGREYDNWDELPEEFRHNAMWSDALGMRYMVYAFTKIDGKEISSVSMCWPIDQPNKKYGRNKTLGRLQQKLANNERIFELHDWDLMPQRYKIVRR